VTTTASTPALGRPHVFGAHPQLGMSIPAGHRAGRARRLSRTRRLHSDRALLFWQECSLA